MTENKPQDKENKGHAEQMDMRHTHQGVQGFPGILYNDSFDIVVSIKIG